MGDELGYTIADAAPAPGWPDPDKGVLQQHRRAAPPLPLSLFGPAWGNWIADAARAASAPPDYVAAPLLAAASALIGNARWAQCGPGWREPPHLWFGVVGDSGSSKTPAAAALLHVVLPELERRMAEGLPDQKRDWKAKAALHNALMETWQTEVKSAAKSGHPPPLPPADDPPQKPQDPRLMQGEVTVEQMALVEAAAPKGVLVNRDELAGFLLGMTTYNDAGRAFWLEAWNGGPFRVERVKLAEPVLIARHVVALFGGIQPDRLAELMDTPDDGLLARFAWVWPEPVPFNLADTAPGTGWAIAALDRLRRLALVEATSDGTPPAPQPRYVSLAPDAVAMMIDFGRALQDRQQDAGGLLRSALGKARGLALRLSLVLAYLDWCAAPEGTPEPAVISAEVFGRAADLVESYLIPMAERVYGDAAAAPGERHAATLARRIMRDKLPVVSVRELCRHRLPGLRDAEAIHAAAARLVEAGWLAPMAKGDGRGRPRAEYPVNPALRGAK